MKNIVIITSNQIRHTYFRLMFANNNNINVFRTYVESDDTSLDLSIKQPELQNLNDEVQLHFDARHNTEYDFFSDVIELVEDRSSPKIIGKGDINDDLIVDEVIKLEPDLIVTYGCSLIKPRLINAFKNRIINVHLGLSPYYFGAGTNFHCLVNNEFQFEGYTFMYIDHGVDTGEIIHQSRATILPFDNPHQIGNRLIKQMTHDFVKLIVNFHMVEPMEAVTDFVGKTYKNVDATPDLTLDLYRNFRNNAVIEFLKEKDSLVKRFPLIEQPFLM